MLTPAIISLIIATIFFSFSSPIQRTFLTFNQGQQMKSGRILGVSEHSGDVKTLSGQSDGLDQIVNKVIEGAGTLSLPQLYRLPSSGQSPRQTSVEQLSGLGAAERAGETAPILSGDDLSAESGVILDCDDNNLVFAKRPDQSWPIASITKLFTAYTFLDYNPGWGTDYKIKLEDKREGGKIYLFTGDVVTVKDLFYASLVGSDNTATVALARTTGLSEADFVEKMNAKIKELGLKSTKLVDPAGLEDKNVSTAREVALFARVALAREEIGRASLTKRYEFSTKQGRKKIINSTDDLLNSSLGKGISILGGKTGYVNSAGYCLVGQFKNEQGQAIVTVILGADSDGGRFSLTRKLVDSYYKMSHD